jgi:uncharacterized SAM-binding protein YcdF (DUF218 family)
MTRVNRDTTGPNRTCLGLLCRRQCLVPTLRGWLLLAVSLVALSVLAVLELPSFLAVTDPVPGGVLVVEGWEPDYMLKFATAEFKRNHYTKIFVTGLPIEQGVFLSEYTNFANVGAASLARLGMDANDVQAVPCSKIRRDRTYNTALALKHWLRDHDLAPTKVNVITGGLHARRSRLLFQEALGKGVSVGVIAMPPNDYDERQWWRSSQGVRGLIGETLAYLYARLLFYPPQE